jgi:hypothetical protein
MQTHKRIGDNMIAEWVLVSTLITTSPMRMTVEVVKQFKTESQCETAKAKLVETNDLKYVCAKIDYN